MQFDEPSKDFDGIRINPRDAVGHLLLVWATEYISDSPTKYTKPGQMSDVIVVDVVDLDGVDPTTGQPGLLAQGVWWRQSRLIQKLKTKIGNPDPLLVWMTHDTSTLGANAPFQLQTATADSISVQRAQEWAARNPSFLPRAAVPVPVPVQPAQPAAVVEPPQESMLERMARQAQAGAGRLPPPPQQPDKPGF